ncbi:PH domain-containing protein [Ornithinimicrobium faecis]|uniref:PH domain-containing protein n=1 Tax=Ornithinimicrobium faecis TaxID=2934158 RepID=UPI003CE5A32E
MLRKASVASGQISHRVREVSQSVRCVKGCATASSSRVRGHRGPTIQGITGKRTDHTSLPFSKVQVSLPGTAVTFDLDAELELS